MTIVQPPTLYNQSVLGDDDFVANFVARQKTLETLHRRLLVIGSEDDGQHQILIGGRGMGKTSLLRRLAIEINRSTDLSERFIPLMFREEQYNVLHLRDFWQNCGEALAEWAEAQGIHHLAERLDDEIFSEAWTEEEAAADRFHAELEALGKRAVLLVDNLDLILGALKKEARWSLRASLQKRGGPILVGAATQSLRETTDRKAAFYEFFQPNHLEPLSLPETETCMRALASRRKESGRRVIHILQSDPARLSVLHRLTGGNPRVLALTYRLLESADSNGAMADLERLLDEVTPYYKAQVEDYKTPLQRATIDAIALHWDPVTTGELSRITGVPTTTLSPQLNRLRKDGLIEITETSGSYSGHQIVERFLNIWYLMRHGTRRTKQRMRWLVAFLSSFYTSHELAEIDREAKDSGLADHWTRDYALAFSQAKQIAALSPEELRLVAKSGDGGTRKNDFGLSTDAQEAKAMIDQGLALSQRGDATAEIEVYDALIARFGDSDLPELHEQVAWAMLYRGVTLGQNSDAAAEIGSYDALLARFCDSELPILHEQVASAMLYKGITHGQNGDAVAEIETYDALITRFGGSEMPELQEKIAWAMLSKGVALSESGDAAMEIATYEGLIVRFRDSEEPELQELAARAMLYKGITLGRIGNASAEIETYDVLYERYGDSDLPELQEIAARAMRYKGITLGQMGDSTAKIETYDALLARFGKSDLPELQEHIALAMLSKGIALGQVGEAVAELETYGALIAQFFDSDLPDIQKRVAQAMVNTGITIRQGGDAAKAIETYDAIIEKFGDSKHPQLNEQIARAMLCKGVALFQSGDAAMAVETHEALITRFDDNQLPELQELIAQAMVGKGVSLGEVGDAAEEIATYDALLARFGGSDLPGLQEHLAWAMFFKGVALSQSSDTTDELSCYEQSLNLFQNISSETSNTSVAHIALRIGKRLFDLGINPDRSEVLLLEAVEHHPLLAYANLFWLYLSNDRIADAKETLGKLGELPIAGRRLIDAALALSAENFGKATGYLEAALSEDLFSSSLDFTDDLERLIRIALAKGFGKRLLGWFEKTRFAERYAPIYVALRALVHGEKLLLDSNPEVRHAANLIYHRLAAKNLPTE